MSDRSLRRSCARNIFLLGIAALFGSSITYAACTRDQAFNRMMALNQYGMKLQAALPDPLKDPKGYEASYQRVNDFSSRLGAVGKPLADAKYDEACIAYDALAKQYGVDLAAQGVRSLAVVEAEGRHPPKTGCDLAESSRRSMWLTESFQKHAQDAHLQRDDWQQFGKEMEPVGLLMQQDPNQACGLIDTIASKYGFRRAGR
ncbi:MAG: hypothetical protein ABIS07_04815 [Dokdonella sp.]